MKWKLPISIAVLFVLNVVTFALIKADIDTKDETNSFEATIDRTFPEPAWNEEKERIEKFEKVLYSIPYAKKRLGLQADPMMRQVFEDCETYKEYGLTLPIVMGIIEVESHFNPLAVGRDKSGIIPESFGLMQVTPKTAKMIVTGLGYEYDSSKMLQPDVNISIGTLYLVFLHQWFVTKGLEKKDEFHVSLAAYNKGIEKVIKSLKNGKFPSFKYSNKVKMASNKWVKAGF